MTVRTTETSTTSTAGPLRLVCFELRGQELALPIEAVRETLPIQPITRVILTPPALAGVFSLRGDILPVIDLGVLFGLSRTEVGSDSRIVVIQDATGTAGVVVDRLRDLRTIDTSIEGQQLEPPPTHLGPGVAQLLVRDCGDRDGNRARARRRGHHRCRATARAGSQPDAPWADHRRARR
ncbi:MAG: chemotaxis protein CheW [Kofleriaceae bacterium]